MYIQALYPFFASAGAYYAFKESDGVGKTVVILLFLGSMLTWTIMIEKGLSLFRARNASEKFMQLFRKTESPFGNYRNAINDNSPLGHVYKTGIERLFDFYGVTGEEMNTFNTTGRYPCRHLTASQLEALRTILEREVSDQILILEEKIGLLATAVSVSPFFGLFGTVWGVMIAFCGVAAKGRADISALAPGVSGALLTTVVGLLVAIPSLIGYNLLAITIRKITVYMDNFVEEFIAKVKLEQLNQNLSEE
ncbi:MAG: MotA/TolQ/ExbB proton channel family protein [Victivallaceae bacterium]|nr:MotA/TolQ/ExbB proton channel family protein [Victivallaceae bacterium]